MTNQELIDLIIEYNAAEAAQRSRLIEIYRAMRDRSGSGRYIAFGSKTRWTPNAFQAMEERFSIPMHVDPLVETITDYQIN